MIARDIIGVCSLVCSLACVSLALAFTPVARAESRVQRQISWPDDLPSGAECASYTQIERRIEAELGGSLSDADFTHTFRVAIEKREQRWHLLLVSDHDGERTERSFEGDSCREVTDAAVLVIALSLDDVRRAKLEDASSAASDTNDASDAPGAATDAPDRKRDRENREAPSPGERLRWGLHANALLELGTLPRAALGVELGASLSWGRSLLSATAVGLPGVRSEQVPDGSRVEVALWAARLRYCHRMLGDTSPARAGLDRASLGICGGAELGRVSGVGVDLRVDERSHFVWGAGWLGLRLALALTSRLALQLEPALAVPVVRRRFVSSDPEGGARDRLHTPKPVSGRIGLGLEARF